MPISSRPNSKSQVIILTLLHEHLTPTQTAIRFGVSRQWIHDLLTRYKTGGLKALEPRSKKPHSNPHTLTPDKRAEIIALRGDLLSRGLDAGAASIAWHIQQKNEKENKSVTYVPTHE